MCRMSEFKGTHWSKMPNAEEIRQRIAAAKRLRPTRYWAGRTHSLETRKKISASKRASATTPRGERHHEWKGGVVSEHEKARGSLAYRMWRDAVYARDNRTCRSCGLPCSDNQIAAHHIEGFSEHKALRYDVENGVTLHRSCHAREHWRLRRLAAEGADNT